MDKRENFTSLDIAKFLAAYLVIILHTSPLASYSSVGNVLLRWYITPVAVPLFFAISGFLFYQKMAILDKEKQMQYLLRYEKRLLLIYSVWSAIYFPFVLSEWLDAGGITIERVLLYVKQVFFVGSYSTIWFLLALAVAIPMGWLLSMKMTPLGATLVGFAFYCIASVCSEAYGTILELPVAGKILLLYMDFFEGFKNGLFFGLVFVSLGMLISEHRLRVEIAESIPESTKELSAISPPRCGTSSCIHKRVIASYKKCFLCTCACMFIMAIETTFELVIQQIWHIPTFGCDFKIWMVPLIYFLMLLMLEMKIDISGTLSQYLRKLSMLMFLSQRLFMALADALIDSKVLPSNSMLYFVVVFACTITFSFALIHLSKHIPRLKKIY